MLRDVLDIAGTQDHGSTSAGHMLAPSGRQPKRTVHADHESERLDQFCRRLAGKPVAEFSCRADPAPAVARPDRSLQVDRSDVLVTPPPRTHVSQPRALSTPALWKQGWCGRRTGAYRGASTERTRCVVGALGYGRKVRIGPLRSCLAWLAGQARAVLHAPSFSARERALPDGRPAPSGAWLPLTSLGDRIARKSGNFPPRCDGPARFPMYDRSPVFAGWWYTIVVVP